MVYRVIQQTVARHNPDVASIAFRHRTIGTAHSLHEAKSMVARACRYSNSSTPQSTFYISEGHNDADMVTIAVLDGRGYALG